MGSEKSGYFVQSGEKNLMGSWNILKVVVFDIKVAIKRDKNENIYLICPQKTMFIKKMSFFVEMNKRQ